MDIALTPHFEKFITEQIESGRFHNANEVIMAALQVMESDPLRGAPVFPPGSLAHLYTSEADAEEARTAPASSLHVEAW